MRILRRGFYHIEFDFAEGVEVVLQLNPIFIKEAVIFFTHWHQDFLPDEATKTREICYPLIAVFPGLTREYVPFLECIGNQLGIVVKSGDEIRSGNAHNLSMPMIKVLMNNSNKLPAKVYLPTCRGGRR